MYAAKADDMKKIDKGAIEKYGIPGIVLMENAAIAIFKRIESRGVRKVLILCGTGNNGGDGFALARLLYVKGYDIEIYCFGEIDKVSGDAKINLDILNNMGIEIKNKIDELPQSILTKDIVIDGLLGTGIRGIVREPYYNAIKAVNELSKYTISIDIPSGINSDNGEMMGISIKANETVTFGCAKYGHLLLDGREHTGRLTVEDISIPHSCIEEQNLYGTTNYGDYPVSLIKKRQIHSNKGDYGRVYIVGGSHLMSGAVILAAKGAIRSGSGLVTCVIPESILNRVGSSVIEATYMTCTEENGFIKPSIIELDEIMAKANVIAFGMGIGKTEELAGALEYLLENSEKPILLDADGLNMLSGIKNKLKNSRTEIVITPHPGEMSRLTGLGIEHILKNSVDTALNFAREYGVTVLLKGASTIVTDGEKIYINTSGNPGMASGGSGDVLSGVIASLMGQGYGAFDSAVLGSYIHGRAGDVAFELYGYGLRAEDITNCLCYK